MVRVAKCLFPLAVPCAPPGLDSEHVRASQLAGFAATTINELFCGNSIDSAATGGHSAELLTSVHANLFEPASRMAVEFDAEQNPFDCFASVCGSHDYQYTPTTCVPLELGKLSLPAVGTVPQPLSRLLGPTGISQVSAFCESCVLPIEERARRVSELGITILTWTLALKNLIESITPSLETSSPGT